MRIFIHAGMPKTGSSAIQASMSKFQAPNWGYLPWRGINHGPLLMTLFEDHPERHRLFASRPDPAAEVDRTRAEWLPQVEAALANTGPETVIISSERIFNMPPEAKQRMADFLRSRRSEIQVIVYVRPPVSYLSSAFQQNIASGAGPLDLGRTWPRYRARIGALDRIFGRRNVKAIKFQRDTLVGGDAVLDFAHQIGVDFPPEKVINTNESRPLQAVAVIYAMRIAGQNGADLPKLAPRDHTALALALAGLGQDKFALAAGITDPLMAQNSEDVDWIEQRLGQPMRVAEKTAQSAVQSVDDLLMVAHGQRAGLAAMVADHKGPLPPHLNLINCFLKLG